MPGPVAQGEDGEAASGQVEPGGVVVEQVLAVEVDRGGVGGDEPARIGGHGVPPGV
jgi:hypothetical protein